MVLEQTNPLAAYSDNLEHALEPNSVLYTGSLGIKE